MDRLAPSRNIPIYVTEAGWPVHDGQHGVSGEQSADYLQQFMLLAKARAPGSRACGGTTCSTTAMTLRTRSIASGSSPAMARAAGVRGVLQLHDKLVAP